MKTKKELLARLKKAKKIEMLFNGIHISGFIQEIKTVSSYIKITFRSKGKKTVEEVINFQFNKNLMVFFHSPSDRLILSLIRPKKDGKYLQAIFYR